MEKNKTGKRRSTRLKWGMAVVCLFLLLGLAACRPKADTPPEQAEQSGELEQTQGWEDTLPRETFEPIGSDPYADAIYLNGNGMACYFPVSDYITNEYKDKGMDLSEANLTEDDLGEMMGVVTDSKQETLNGCSAFRFAQDPDKVTVCIVDTPDGYRVYMCNWLDIEVETGGNSDEFLAAYGLPERLGRMSVYSVDSQTVDRLHLSDLDAEDADQIILEILAGNTSIGQPGLQRLFAQLWYDTYGNEDVSCEEDEVDGKTWLWLTQEYEFYDGKIGVPPEKRTDGEGRDYIVPSENPIYLSDLRRELFHRDERWIKIETTHGFRENITYYPSVGVLEVRVDGRGGFYEISSEKKEVLDTILQVQDNVGG